MSDFDFDSDVDNVRRTEAGFDVVFIDLSWRKAFGELVYRGDAPLLQRPNWEDAFEIHFGRVEAPNISHSNAGAGEKAPDVISIPTITKRAGRKTASSELVNARLIARPAEWPATLTVKIATRTDWTWSGLQASQAIEFHAPEPMQLGAGLRKRADTGVIKVDLTNPAPPPSRGTFLFEAVLL